MKQIERTEQTKEWIITVAMEEFGSGYSTYPLNNIAVKHDISEYAERLNQTPDLMICGIAKEGALA